MLLNMHITQYELTQIYRNSKKNMVNILCYIYTIIYNNKINAVKPCPKQAPV